jgi:hypothetical protein
MMMMGCPGGDEDPSGRVRRLTVLPLDNSLNQDIMTQPHSQRWPLMKKGKKNMSRSVPYLGLSALAHHIWLECVCVWHCNRRLDINQRRIRSDRCLNGESARSQRFVATRSGMTCWRAWRVVAPVAREPEQKPDSNIPLLHKVGIKSVYTDRGCMSQVSKSQLAGLTVAIGAT